MYSPFIGLSLGLVDRWLSGRVGHQRPTPGVPDRSLILNERHLTFVFREYLIFYNGHRPHQPRKHRPRDIATQPACDVTDLTELRIFAEKLFVMGTINEHRNAT